MHMSFGLTNHASARMQQRGLSMQAVDYVLENADKSEFVGSGCREKWISRRCLRALRGSGEHSHLIDRATGVAVIVSEDDMVVTIYHKTKRTRHKKNKQHKFQRRVN
jgi:hypothetical protein